jgi:hypothetical protein
MMKKLTNTTWKPTDGCGRRYEGGKLSSTHLYLSSGLEEPKLVAFFQQWAWVGYEFWTFYP